MTVDVVATPPVAPAVAVLASLSGSRLLAALEALPRPSLSGHEVVLVHKAASRLLNSVGGLRAGLTAEIAVRTDPAFGRREVGDRRAASELRTELMISRQAATSMMGLALDLATRLPGVLAGWAAGVLDQARVEVFHQHTQHLPAPLVDQIVGRLLPDAPRLTAGRLAREIQRLAIDLDPDSAQRRLEAGLAAARVDGRLNPDGTASLSGRGLAPDEAATVTNILDAMARRIKDAGHPWNYQRLRAEIYTGRLNGRYHGLTDEQVCDHLIAGIPDLTTTADPAGPATTETADPAGPATTGPAEPAPATVLARPLAPGRVTGHGLRLKATLKTLAGLSQRSGQLLGWGPLTADLVRRMAAAPHARWHYTLRDPQGYVTTVGVIRPRPPAGWVSGAVPDYPELEVWVSLTETDLTTLLAHPPPGWEKVITAIATDLAVNPSGAPNSDPTARLPDARLRRWLGVRDQYCTFPADCPVPAHYAQVDHSRDWAHDGPTIDTNLAHMCGHDHRLKHRFGWRVIHLTPGQIRWISPLGHHYRHDPPTDPDPDPDDDPID